MDYAPTPTALLLVPATQEEESMPTTIETSSQECSPTQSKQLVQRSVAKQEKPRGMASPCYNPVEAAAGSQDIRQAL
jgi:hypothetical protein